MADNIFTRLGRLFQSNVVIRKTDDNRLIVKDLDYTQTSLTSNFIDRYNRLVNYQQSGSAGKYSARENARNAYEVARNELFRDYIESKDKDTFEDIGSTVIIPTSVIVSAGNLVNTLL